MRLTRAVFLTALIALTTAPVIAAGPDPIAIRKDGLHTLGSAFKNVNDELKSGTPQPFILQLSAKQIRAAAAAQYGWFPAGSGPRDGVKTAAKPEIWAQPVQFKAAQDAFSAQAQAFFKLSTSGDLAKMQAGAKALGQTCATCHKTFRAERK
jgi:cytochrome c556